MQQSLFGVLRFLALCEIFLLCKAFANLHQYDRLSSQSSTTTSAPTTRSASSSSSLQMTFPNIDDGDNMNNFNNNNNNNIQPVAIGRLEELKQQEIQLARQLASIRIEKLSALRSRPLTIGIVGFGRFGQFIARTFAKHGRVVVTSRSDYTALANGMGVTYVSLDKPDEFLNHGLDVIIMAVSILSFEDTVKSLVGPLRNYVWKANNKGPLLVDVLSVKEHPRTVMLNNIPPECDILCTHPMFGPDSGRNGWHNLNFVFERTRVDKVVFDPNTSQMTLKNNERFVDTSGRVHSVHEDNEAHVESMDRIERFLSIWEEEGCNMVPMSCQAHDEYAANSQFITHLMGRILGKQGLAETPIDTKGFQSVLKLVDSTTADSFDLFYGLYKYNQNSMETIRQLQAAMEEVVQNLKKLEDSEQQQQVEEEEGTVSSNQQIHQP